MRTALSRYFTYPTPLITVVAGGPKKRGRQPIEEKKEVTEHRDGGPIITNPSHGKSGWFNGVLVIFNNDGTDSGWYKLADYQALKVIKTNRPDFRIMPEHYYTDLGPAIGGTVLDSPFSFPALYKRKGAPFHHRSGSRRFM